jgi:hypothetical protein
MGFLLLNKVREEALGRKPKSLRRVSRNVYAIFFPSDFQSTYPIVQEIWYREEEGIGYFPLLSQCCCAWSQVLFISYSMKREFSMRIKRR